MKKKGQIIFLSLFVSSFLFSSETSQLETIKVNANKMEENIKDIPQSITVISKEDIEEKAIKNIKDLIQEIPNMNIGTSYGSEVSFRGLNPSIFTNNNPIVIYVDGLAYSDRFNFNPSFNDIEQVEILRGSQGTIYGKDAIGGVINIVTKAPANKWSGDLITEYANDNTFNAKVSASGSLIEDKLYTGINLSYNHSDGWIKNHYPNMDNKANKYKDRKTSGFLLYKSREDLMTKLIISNNYDKKYFTDGIVTNGDIELNNLKRIDSKNVSFEVPTFHKSKLNSQAFNLSYEKEKIKFDSITTHKKVDISGQYDYDYKAEIPTNGYKVWNFTKIDTYTQEFKLTSKNQDLKWIIGLYMDKEKRRQEPFGGEMFGAIQNINSEAKNHSKAIFGQVIIPLKKSLDLTLGARYQYIKKDIDVKAQMLSPFAHMMGYPYGYKDKKTWKTFLPKMALAYKINDNLSSYISVSKGYMPGGFNYSPSNNKSEENTFEAQKSINYEIGIRYIANDFTFNTNIFRMDIKDIHIHYMDSNNNFFSTNAKKAHSYGLEFEGNYFLTDNLSLSSSFGLIQAKYDDYTDGIRKYDNEDIQNTPKYTGTLGLSYYSNKGLYGRLDLYSQGSSKFFDKAKSRMLKAKGGSTLNSKIGYKIKNFDIYVYAKNLTNEEYIRSYIATQARAIAEFNDKREFGFGLNYKF